MLESGDDKTGGNNEGADDKFLVVDVKARIVVVNAADEVSTSNARNNVRGAFRVRVSQ